MNFYANIVNTYVNVKNISHKAFRVFIQNGMNLKWFKEEQTVYTQIEVLFLFKSQSIYICPSNSKVNTKTETKFCVNFIFNRGIIWTPPPPPIHTALSL